MDNKTKARIRNRIDAAQDDWHDILRWTSAFPSTEEAFKLETTWRTMEAVESIAFSLEWIAQILYDESEAADDETRPP